MNNTPTLETLIARTEMMLREERYSHSVEGFIRDYGRGRSNIVDELNYARDNNLRSCTFKADYEISIPVEVVAWYLENN